MAKIQPVLVMKCGRKNNKISSCAFCVSKVIFWGLTTKAENDPPCGGKSSLSGSALTTGLELFLLVLDELNNSGIVKKRYVISEKR